MLSDPRIDAGEFGLLFHEIQICKKSKNCPSLTIRPYYFEPNPDTVIDWQEREIYQGKIDGRLVFVCESPGPSAMGYTAYDSPKTKKCWDDRGSSRDKRFLEVRMQYGLQNCFITNTVKCGPRQGSRHSDAEFNACLGFLVRELELIKPKVVVGVGNNATDTLRKRVEPFLNFSPRFFRITHYSARRNPWDYWNVEFPQLLKALADRNEAI